MKNSNKVFVLLSAAIGIMLFLRSEVGKIPNIPNDDFHKMLWTNASCGECHASNKQNALKDTHPSEEQCLSCHKMSDAFLGD